VVTLSYLLERPQEVSQSLIPVVTLSNSVDTAAEEYLTTQSLIPVVTLSSSVDDTVQAKVASQSLIPVVGVQTQVNRVTASITREVPQELIPVVTLSVSTRTSGDVDAIEISSRPYGYIEIRQA
jgi:hypothetical protein